MVVEKTLRGLTTANLRSLRFSSNPGLLVEYLRDLETVYQSYTTSPILTVDMKDIVGEDFAPEIFLPVGRVRPGSSPLVDLTVMAALTKRKQPRCVFEIGTFEGLSTVVFIKNGNDDTRVHTLDLPHDRKEIERTARSYSAHSINAEYVSGHLIDVFGVREQTHALFGDSAVFDFSPYWGQVDLFFIDGAHTEDYVLNDSSKAFECLAPDAWVLWHDCFTPQVMKALKRVAEVTRVLQIRGTSLALSMQKPNRPLLSAAIV